MADLDTVLATLQDGVRAINALRIQLATTFPPLTNPSSTAPAAGTITFNSSQAAAFGLVTTSSGGSYRIALLPSS